MNANPREILTEAKPKRRARRIQGGGKRPKFDPGPFRLADGRIRHVCPFTGRSRVLTPLAAPPPVGSFDEPNPDDSYLEGLL